jgi:hypothetical protein
LHPLLGSLQFKALQPDACACDVHVELLHDVDHALIGKQRPPKVARIDGVRTRLYGQPKGLPQDCGHR